MPQSTIATILEYVWVPIVTGMIWLWGRVFGVDARTRLLEQQAAHYREQRKEDQERHAENRKETLGKIDSHHKTVMTKLGQVETRIKNGG